MRWAERSDELAHLACIIQLARHSLSAHSVCLYLQGKRPVIKEG